MILFKCECGSFFTVKGHLRDYRLKCPSCQKPIQLYGEMEVREIAGELNRNGVTMQIIPDDSKITVTFDP